ncbi:MAG: hypothetical protein AAGA85_04400 [Bacteroidota bacterium]
MRLQLATVSLAMLLSCASYRKGPDLWTSAQIPEGMAVDSLTLPTHYQVFRFEVDMLRDALKDVGDSENESLLVQLPDPENAIGPFKVWQSGVVSRQMARKYPGLIAYKGFCTSDVTSKIRMEVPTTGMQVMVITAEDTWFISPLDSASNLYMMYRKEDFPGGNQFWEGKVN